MRVVKILAVGVVLAAVALGVVAYVVNERVHAPYKGYSQDEVFFTVDRGSSGGRIARELEEAGIVEDRRIFDAALRLRDARSSLQAGEYRFAEAATPLDVVDKLAAGDVYTFSVTVPEGLTVAETAAHLETLGLGSAEDLEAAFGETLLISELDASAIDLEGYLFPTTYQLRRNPTPDVIARTMVAQFESVFDEARRKKSDELGLTVREVVTLASMVEKETGAEEERPLIASVFWNRIERGMALASDPTIIFALKQQGTWNGNLRRVDLELESPYNTYRVPGIPPGPIASPGLDSIDAVLDPPETRYLFFVSKNDGTSHFSQTFREHANAVQKYQVEYFRNRRRARNGDGPS